MSDQSKNGNGFDPLIPDRVMQQIREEQPRPEAWSDDLKILLDPNVQAKSQVLPMVGTVEYLNHDYRYFWARLKRGNNPDSSRIQQLRALGFDNATAYDAEKNPAGDVKVVVADVGVNFTEIISGDRLLMKAPRHVYDSFRKQYMMDSLNMTTNARRGKFQDVDPSRRMNTLDSFTMKSSNFGPGAAPMSSTDFSGNREGTVDVEQILQRGNAGNTSVVKHPGRK